VARASGSAIRRTALIAAAILAFAPSVVHAIPAFARKYRMTCVQCHSPFPRLNAIGEQFAANGFQFSANEAPTDTLNTGDPLLRLQRDIPLAVRFDAYLQTLGRKYKGQIVRNDLQTPWGIKLLSGGQIAEKVSYYMYFFLTERGAVTGLEDAYVQFTDIGSSGVSAIVGQFQVSDPLFKRELRLEYEDYEPYRFRVGGARPNLTYDRGIMLTYSPWEGGDLAGVVVTGQGLRNGEEDRAYDSDEGKDVAIRFSQDIGPLRVGAYGYFGRERADGQLNRLRYLGPDATLTIGSDIEVNLQYLRRHDDNPFFAPDCSGPACPAASGSNDVDAAFGEVIWSPGGPAGRYVFTGLVNWIDSQKRAISLYNVHDADPGDPLGRYLSRARSAAAGMTYVMRRNLRLMGEVGYDLDNKKGRLTTGFVTAF
jgi:hypothetical protein